MRVFGPYAFAAILLACWPTMRPPLVVGVCPPKCHCDDDALVVTCEGANLNEVPITLNPGVRQLFLRRNSIRALDSSLTFYKELEYLDLSQNQLTALQATPPTFATLGKLRVLKLSRNLISALTVNDSFTGLNTLRVLQLDDNQMSGVPSRAFAPLVAAEELDLSDNRIAVLSADAFEGLSSLRVLRLRRNRLERVPAVALASLPGLALLDLAANPLGSLEEATFSALPALHELGLDECRLHHIGGDALRGLSNLRALHARGNALTHVPPFETWTHVPRLEELALGGNPFDELPPDAFVGLRALRLLEIVGAPRLYAIRERAFAANAALRSLVLNLNVRLVLLEAGALYGLPHLRHLALRENALRTLAEDLLAWDELDTLDVAGNPFECNCSLLWLRDVLRSKNTSSSSSHSTSSSSPVSSSNVVPECWTPSSLRQRSLAELSADDLGCFFPNAQQQAIFGIAAAVLVACLASLIFIVYKCRKRVTRVLKDQWTEGALRSKDVHYEKTNEDDENSAQLSPKLTPLSEL